MRLYIYTLFIFLFVSNLHGQDSLKSKFHYGLTIGGHISNVINSPHPSHRLDWSFGIPLRLERPHFFLQFTPAWISKGGTGKLENGDSGDKEIFQYEYLELPLTMGIYLYQSLKTRTYIYTGMAMSRFLFGRYTTVRNNVNKHIYFPHETIIVYADIKSTDGTEELRAVPVLVRKREYGVVGGFGMEFQGKNRPWLVEFNYHQALNSTLSLFEHPYRNQYFGLRIGTFFK